MVDDSHAVGFVGENGRGSHEYCEVMGRVDIITGTLGKALGGASGGYTAARKEVVEWLRQRSVRTCSPTHWLRRLWRRPLRCWKWLSPAMTCAIACGQTLVSSVSKCPPLALR